MSNDIIKEFNDTSYCILNIDEVLKLDWSTVTGKKSPKICRDAFISKWSNEYTFVLVRRFSRQIKVRILKEQAMLIIKLMNLDEEKSPVFNSASTFRLNQQQTR